MVKRKKIGLLFVVDDNWIGGTYYILNLVHALNTLPNEQKPMLVVLSTDAAHYRMVVETGYPYLTSRNPFNYKRNLPEKLINAAYRKITGRDIIDKRISGKEVDCIFPASDSHAFEKITNKIYWIPDFQHKHYPEYFIQQEIDSRDESLRKIAQSQSVLVLSSEHAKRDFEKFAPDYQCKVSVIPFAVTHPKFEHLYIDSLKSEYNIEGPYFLIPNQFWKHKNQLVVLKAICILKEKNFPYTFVFTGKETDRRNPGYYESILSFVKENDLGHYIRILGLIPRDKQLKLLNQSEAVIQPSLFEGWSTVVEDAKAQNKHIIVSDIEVHREQLTGNCTFFNPCDEVDLASKLEQFNRNEKVPVYANYRLSVEEFAKKYIKSTEVYI